MSTNYRYGRPNRLYRDKENGIIMGVCAGIADFLDFQRGMVRVIAFVLLLIWTLPTLFAYFVLGFLMRAKPLCYHGRDDERNFWRRSNTRCGSDY
ncbi:MAG: PspC domain-containing protein [Pseudomonadota bacterium]